MPERVTNPPLFALGLVPSVATPADVLEYARIADEAGLELLSVWDHPYNPEWFDAWTLLSYVAARTSRIKLWLKVANLPLRHPAVLAQAAASLDILTDGRVEVGLGAGAAPKWQAGLAAYVPPAQRSRGQLVDAVADAISISRLLWDASSQPVEYAGREYHLRGALPGPRPPHPIPIWVGAYSPRLLRVTGRLADGWTISHEQFPPQSLVERNAIIDAAATEAGRRPTDIRRDYNLSGTITDGATSGGWGQAGGLVGPPERWVEEILRLYHEFGMDTFLFQPPPTETRVQIQRFAEDVAPRVRRLAAAQELIANG